MSDESNHHRLFLNHTFLLARSAFEKGNRPFGALLVVDNEIVLEFENTVSSSQDITAHAEMNLIRGAWKQLPRDTLEKATLYTSTEPCMMCAGAIVNSPIRHVVFGCRATLMHEKMGESVCMSGKAVLLSSDLCIQVEGPLFENDAIQVHLDNQWW